MLNAMFTVEIESIYEKSGDGIRNNISNSGIKSKIVGLSQK